MAIVFSLVPLYQSTQTGIAYFIAADLRTVSAVAPFTDIV